MLAIVGPRDERDVAIIWQKLEDVIEIKLTKEGRVFSQIESDYDLN